VYQPAPVVYQAPPPVVYEPAPVVYQAPPRVVYRAPVVVQAPPRVIVKHPRRVVYTPGPAYVRDGHGHWVTPPPARELYQR
jgi:hypothetical protein